MAGRDGAGAAGPRRALEQHVVEVQRTIRTCAGCGLCCTAAYNSVEILPVEARRIASHLRTLPPGRLTGFVERLRRTITRFGLGRSGPKRNYTCTFLEKDLTCALPLHVKPVACLAFNPQTPDHCDMEGDWYHGAHDAVEAHNRVLGLSARKTSIPVAALMALGEPVARTLAGKGPRSVPRSLPGAGIHPVRIPATPPTERRR